MFFSFFIFTAISYTIVGEGNTSCGVWIDRRQESPEKVLPEAAWVLGFVTAMSKVEARAQTGLNLTKGLVGTSTDHWIDNYCAKNPLETIDTAANALVIELRRRAASNSN